MLQRLCHQRTLLDPIGPGAYRPSSDIFSPGTAAPDCEDDGLESVSDVQAASKKAISKTRMPVGTTRLITNPNVCAGHLRCNPAARRGHRPPVNSFTFDCTWLNPSVNEVMYHFRDEYEPPQSIG
jgi:hypothetical protein